MDAMTLHAVINGGYGDDYKWVDALKDQFSKNGGKDIFISVKGKESFIVKMKEYNDTKDSVFALNCIRLFDEDDEKCIGCITLSSQNLYMFDEYKATIEFLNPEKVIKDLSGLAAISDQCTILLWGALPLNNPRIYDCYPLPVFKGVLPFSDRLIINVPNDAWDVVESNIEETAIGKVKKFGDIYIVTGLNVESNVIEHYNVQTSRSVVNMLEDILKSMYNINFNSADYQVIRDRFLLEA